MKNNMQVKMISNKQQVSKILMSQIKKEIKDMMHYEDAAIIKRSVAATLCDSAYHKDGSLRSWGQDGVFNFVFEFGRKGGVRISYCNSNGLQSAVFQHDEWDSLKYMLKSMVDKAISDIEKCKDEEKRKEEQERFEAAVAEAVRKELQKQQWQEKQVAKTHKSTTSDFRELLANDVNLKKAVPDDGELY